MPSVAIPLSPHSFGLQGGKGGGHYKPTISASTMTPAEIKQHAIDTVTREARGVGPMQLINSANTVAARAAELESSGDLQGALSHYIKVVTLIKRVIESHEFKVESNGALHRSFYQFMEKYGKDLPQHTAELEQTLKAMQETAAAPAASPTVGKSGGSIADRLRSLEESSGNTLRTTKRLSREPPISLSSPPMSADSRTTSFASSSTPVSATSSYSPHTLVSPSTFGPDSPASSPGSSLSQLPVVATSISEFNNTYPPIEEIEPSSIPSGLPSSSNRNGFMPDTSALTLLRSLQSPTDRPSSTPIPPKPHPLPSVRAFESRPASPRPLPPPPRPTQAPQPPSLTVKPSLPVTASIYPAKLAEYMKDPNLKLLIIDVRTRSEFDADHIRNGKAVICIEPSILLRKDLKADALENALSVSPSEEATLFTNRDKFDLVVLSDTASTSIAQQTPLAQLESIIYTKNLATKFLKNRPVLLIGGWEAWRRHVGGDASSHGGNAPPADTSSRPRADTGTVPLPQKPINGFASSVLKEHRPTQSLDQSSLSSSHSRTPADHTPNGYSQQETVGSSPLSRRPAMRSNASISGSAGFSKNPYENMSAGPSTPPMAFGSVTYPQYPRGALPMSPVSATMSNYGNGSSAYSTPPNSRYSTTTPGASYPPALPTPILTSPPQASLNPSLSRRRSDFVDQSETLARLTPTRTPIDYPQLSNASNMSNLSLTTNGSSSSSNNSSSTSMPLTAPLSSLALSSASIRPPPAVASPALGERHDNRPRLPPQRPRLGSSDWPVTYWHPASVHTSGLKNLGNTCYINAIIQCLNATVPFVDFFLNSKWSAAINTVDKRNSKGTQTGAFVAVLKGLRQKHSAFDPKHFCLSFSHRQPRFIMGVQQDSQEFLTVFLDEVHQDLNRVLEKAKHEPTAERYAELERLPLQKASEEEWNLYRQREDSIVVDFFQGQFRSRMECMMCQTTSTTYEAFSLLQLTIPPPYGSKRPVTLKECLDKFLAKEVMEKDDAWHCPKCKTLRRATKKYDLSRLPPVLILQLVRFRNHGELTGKIETYVDYPLKGLDLTDCMDTGVNPGSPDDPRTQAPPYKYDLYAVANHSGNLSGGHYTAHIASREGWLYYNDSRIDKARPEDVVSEAGYVLFYKRVRA